MRLWGRCRVSCPDQGGVQEETTGISMALLCDRRGPPYPNTPATGLPQFGHRPFFTVCSLTE